MEIILPDLNKRIKEVIHECSGGSVNAFSKTLENVSQQRLDRIFKPDTRTKKIPSVPDDIITGIAKSYPFISLRWLLTGEGKMNEEVAPNLSDLFPYLRERDKKIEELTAELSVLKTQIEQEQAKKTPIQAKRDLETVKL
ncbi:hypothetical protein Barb6_03131 [Bacteroidales bacterium Barb6]|nr:hypothetical protein Barb6_03131 [Bacteroidales bacterium Barb6]